MRIIRQRFFSEENNNLSNVGEGLALLGGVGAYSSSMLAKDLKEAQKKGKKELDVAAAEADIKNSLAKKELAAKEKRRNSEIKIGGTGRSQKGIFACVV